MKFYGQFETPVDEFIFNRYFPDIHINGIFVECGAFDGQTECSCKFFEETMGWTGINLEPVPRIFDKLEMNRPSSTNLNVGLSDSTRTVKFQAVEHPQFGNETTIGAIKHDATTKEALLASGCVIHEIEVNVISWADFLLRTELKSIDLMVLDVEGHELAVLAGMRGSSVLPQVLCVEFGHVGFDRVRSELSQLGYEYDITSHANAFFVRRDMLPLFAFRQSQSRSERSSTSADVTRLNQEIADIKLSTSWKLTAPLRALKEMLGRG